MPTSTTKVVGRADLISEVISQVAEHRVVTLTGEPGVGKTTVWAEVLSHTHAAWSWSAQCLEAEADLGHAVLADFYQAVPDQVVDALPAPQRRAVDIVLFREDGDSEGSLPGRLLGVTTHSILSLLAEQGQVALGIDDLQWCDPTSMLSFDFAVHRLTTADVVVLTSARPDLDRRFSDAVDIPVPRLPAESIREVVRQATGPLSADSRVAEIAELSGGNPFFACELARHRSRTGDPDDGDLPTSVSALLRRRLDGLDEVTWSLLLDVAVRGADELVHLDQDTLARATPTGLLVREKDRLRFSHPLLSAAVLEVAPAGAIRAAHDRAARSVRDPIAVALHRARSSDPADDVAAELDRVVTVARRRGDVHGAAILAQLALELTPGGARPRERVMTLANLEYALGHSPRAGELAREVLPATDSPRLRAAALICVAGSLADGDAAVATLREAAGINGLPPPDYARVVRAAAFAMHDNGQLLDAVDMVDQALTVVASPEEQWPELVAVAAYLKRFAAIPDDGVLLSRAVEVERQRNTSPEESIHSSAEALGCAAQLAVLDDRREDAATLLREASAAAARQGQLNHSAYYPGLLACRAGDPRAAFELFNDAADADGPNPVAHARMALACVWLGEFDRVGELAARARALFLSERDRGRGEVDYVVGLSLILTGRPVEAWQEVLEGAVDFLDSIGHREPSHPPVLPLAVEAACAAGAVPAATELCARLARDSTAVRSRFGAAAVNSSLGHIAEAQGEVTAAEVHFAAAAEAFTRLQVPLEAGRCLTSLGALLRRTGRRSAAREVLASARALTVSSQAEGLLTMIDAEQARISGRTASSPTELTLSELRVAELAAEGMRNSDIARTLHLSTKTVESHLGRVYRKLGIRNRASLSRALK